MRPAPLPCTSSLLLALLVVACGPTQASLPFCGDGERDPGEACDDGNQIPGDGCSATCEAEDDCDACPHGCDPQHVCWPECNPLEDDCCEADGTGCDHGCSPAGSCWFDCTPGVDPCCSPYGFSCSHGCNDQDVCWPECNPAGDTCCKDNGTRIAFGPDDLCPPGESCGSGFCQPACTAAAAAKGNIACDFTVATPHFYVGIAPPCFAVFLTNTWLDPAVITITRGGVAYDPTLFGRMPNGAVDPATWPPLPATGLPPGQSVVLFLSHDPTSVNGGTPLTCPVTPAVNGAGGSAVVASNLGEAWRIQTDIPVTAYDILPFGGADSYLPSAELLIPTTAWGTYTIAVLPPDTAGPPWGQVVAMTDDTTVEVRPTVNLPAAGPAPAAPANEVTQFTLNAGQYVQWELAAGQDMTGTLIVSDHPVAFTGGNAYICYTSLTSQGGGCDSAHQQIPPVAALGSTYVAAPYPSRGNGLESIRYRLVGAASDTLLAYDPPVDGAATQVGEGEVLNFETPLAFTVTSQDASHPFYLGQIMPGCTIDGNDGCLGDEEWVNLVTPAQYLSEYAFYTDTEYVTTLVAAVRVAEDDGFRAVFIDCLGELTGWTPVGGSGDLEVTTAYLVQDGLSVGACVNGPQFAHSEGLFGLTVWGLDEFSSHAYPVGGSFAPINELPPPI